MDLKGIVDDEFLQPLRGAIVAEDLIATRQLIESVRLEAEETTTRQTVRVYAEAYILELRDGEQYKSPPTIDDIKTWILAKGLEGILDPYAVLATILTEGTTWDKKGGSQKLQAIINKENLKRIIDIAVKDQTTKILSTKWQSL